MAPTHLPMHALDALLNAEHDGDPFLVIFESLQDVFLFDQALVLDDDDDVLRCAAAQPPALSGLCWRPGPFFREVAGGRVAATASSTAQPHSAKEPARLPAKRAGSPNPRTRTTSATPTTSPAYGSGVRGKGALGASPPVWAVRYKMLERPNTLMQ